MILIVHEQDEENAKAMSLFEGVVRRNDEIEDDEKRAENLIRGILAGNIFDLGSAQVCGLTSTNVLLGFYRHGTSRRFIASKVETSLP
jgi:hypothetical protein